MATTPQEPKSELREQIELLCIERGIEVSEVVSAIEQSIASAYRREYGEREKGYDADFDLETGKYAIYETIHVVDEVLNPGREQTIVEARLANPSAEVGDVLRTKLEVEQDINFGRIASQVAKQVFSQATNNARHSRILQQFKDKVGELVTVEVDGSRKGGYLVKIAQTTGFISKENILPIDRFRPGQQIKALIVDIVEDDRGNSRIILSRTSDDFIKALIMQEVPEVASGLVSIDTIMREPGTRSKVVVSAGEDEGTIDPVGTILGRKNVRLLNIMREISPSIQEKIDIIEAREDDEIEEFIMDALEPAEIERVEIIDDENAKVYCYEDEAALAVGKRGSNIRLAGKLVDMELELVTLKEPEQSEINIAAD